MKTGLFGGALVCAGLSTHALAQLQPAFVSSPANRMLVRTEAYDGPPGAIQQINVPLSPGDPWAAPIGITNPAGWDANAYAAAGYAGMYASASMGMAVSINDPTYDVVTGLVTADFTPSYDLDVNLTWDFTAQTYSFYGSASNMRLYDVTGGDALLLITSNYSSGMQTFSLTAGNVYRFDLHATTGEFGSSWGRLEVVPVPAPASVGLLGVAGLAVSRRRRRERHRVRC